MAWYTGDDVSEPPAEDGGDAKNGSGERDASAEGLGHNVSEPPA